MKHFRSGVIPLLLTGVLAAAQLAKFASLAPLSRESHYLSLAATGPLISLLEVGGALSGQSTALIGLKGTMLLWPVLSAIGLTLIRGGVPSNRRLTAALVISLLATAAVAPFIFNGAGLIVSVAVAFVVVTSSGVASPPVFARLPALAGARSSDDPRIAAANGLLTQFGAGGALLGPPLGGQIAAGWGDLGLAISLLAVAMLGALLAAERSSGQRFS